MSVNKVIILGRLGSDPELRNTNSGNAVATFNLATNEYWKDRDGMKQERTEWHRVVVWGKQAEICNKYLAKGRQVYIEGRLQTRSWEDQQGVKRYTTEVVALQVQFIGSMNQQQDNSQFDNANSGPNGNFADFPPEPEFKTPDGNEIPF